MPTDVNLLKDRNMKNWKTRLWVLIVLLNMGMGISTFAQKIPLVYTVENTGIKNPAPVLPGINELPVVKTLTDPFQWSDGSGRSTNFKDWSRRRAEIAREIEHYEIGEKPVVSKKDITANIVDDTLRVNVTVNGQTLTLKAKITYPAGKGPFPAIIGIGRGTGSLPPTIFTSRNIAQIAFNFTQVMSHTQKRGNEPINKLYPDRTDMGAYCAWSWGVSRIIDGFEIVGNAERRTDFILTAISLTDIASVVKFAVVLLAQLGIDLLCTLVELLGQRQDTDFNRCQSRMEMKDSTDISALQLFLVISSA